MIIGSIPNRGVICVVVVGFEGLIFGHKPNRFF